MIHHKEVTASTNLDARAGQPFDVFTADFQTAGRGRLDHVWQSAANQNLMFSIVLPLDLNLQPQPHTLPLVIGLAVLKSLSAYSLFPIPYSLSLKWPNDILANGPKLSGILCERVGDNVIAGIGVNVNQTDFPSDIADRATSLARLLGHTVDRAELLDRLVDSIVAHHARWTKEGFSAIWPEFAPYDFLKGRTVSVLTTDSDPAPVTGLCGGIQRDGSLLVGTQNIFAGEAHILSSSLPPPPSPSP